MSPHCLSGLLLTLAFAATAAAQPARDRYGDPLPEGAVIRLGSVRLRHADGIDAVAYSPDGKLLASAGHDKVIRLWDSGSGRLIRELTGHADMVLSLAFAPDGKRLASAGYGDPLFARGARDNSVRVWDVAAGRELRRFDSPTSGFEGAFAAVDFSPDGHRLAAGAHDGTLWLWDAHSGNELKRWKGHAHAITSVRFAAGGLLASADAGKAASEKGKEEGTLHLWRVPDGARLHTIESPEKKGGILSLAFTPDGKTLAFVIGPRYYDPDLPGSVRVWDVAGRKERHALRARRARDAAFAPDGKTLAVTTAEGAEFWNAASGGRWRRFGSRGQSLGAAAFSPDGRTLAAAGGRAIHLFETALGGEVLPADGHQGEVRALAFSPDGRMVLSGSWDGTARLWDVATGKVLRRWDTGHIVTGAAFAPDGKTIAIAESSGTILITGLAPGDRPRVFDDGMRDIKAVSLSPDGKLLASGSAVWDVANGKQVRRFKEPHERVGFVLDGQVVARADHNGYVSLTDLKTGQESSPFRDNYSGSRRVAFAPDGKRLAALTDNGSVLVRDLKTGRIERAIKVALPALLGEYAWELAWSPDGKTLATSKSNGTVTVWDAATGHVRAHLRGHRRLVNALAFSQDGRKLATGGDDTTVLVWDLNAGGEKPEK